jgi:hypothetical protein
MKSPAKPVRSRAVSPPSPPDVITSATSPTRLALTARKCSFCCSEGFAGIGRVDVGAARSVLSREHHPFTPRFLTDPKMPKCRM